jgi:hypothetical protein
VSGRLRPAPILTVLLAPIASVATQTLTPPSVAGVLTLGFGSPCRPLILRTMGGDGDIDCLFGLKDVYTPAQTPTPPPPGRRQGGDQGEGQPSMPLMDVEGSMRRVPPAPCGNSRFKYFVNTAGPGKTPVFVYSRGTTVSGNPMCNWVADIGATPACGDVNGDGKLDCKLLACGGAS